MIKKYLYVFVIFIIFCIASWINNINYVIDSDYEQISGREVVSIIGIFIPPVGIVNGTIYFFEPEKNEGA